MEVGRMEAIQAETIPAGQVLVHLAMRGLKWLQLPLPTGWDEETLEAGLGFLLRIKPSIFQLTVNDYRRAKISSGFFLQPATPHGGGGKLSPATSYAT